ncbi:MAG: imidazole glycerol phosphate synthase subunit HisH [Candidatus Omnitrophota bacterium]
MVAIIDYGMGNIHSIQKALELYGCRTVVTNNPSEIGACTKAVLPGVGAFDDAMRELKKQGLITAINTHIRDKKPFLGICLGMQLLFEGSEEASHSNGLAILKGGVNRFKEKKGIKVPHMGWNQLKINAVESPLLKNIADRSFVYFCHSYYPLPGDKEIIAASCDYGVEFPCVICRDNIYGVQFHPEKSQETGLRIIKNFVELC